MRATSSREPSASCVARRAVAAAALVAYQSRAGGSGDIGSDICDLITDLMLLARASAPADDPYKLVELASSHFAAEDAGDILMPVRATLSVSARKTVNSRGDRSSAWSPIHPRKTPKVRTP